MGTKCYIYTSANIFRNADSTTSLENLVQCLTIFLVSKVFLVSDLNLS